MSATITPTVLASDAETYSQQMARISPFATRVHIDLADGEFAPSKTLELADVWWPGGVQADLHVMFQRPADYVPVFIGLQPQLVIVHAEADGQFEIFADTMHRHGIAVGIALQAATSPELIRPALDKIDHVLVFSGNLGHFGGQADLQLLDKVKRLRVLKPTLEIGWDGGVNGTNAQQLVVAGVDVLNVGGFIQHAHDPAMAYQGLRRLVTNL